MTVILSAMAHGAEQQLADLAAFLRHVEARSGSATANGTAPSTTTTNAAATSVATWKADVEPRLGLLLAATDRELERGFNLLLSVLLLAGDGTLDVDAVLERVLAVIVADKDRVKTEGKMKVLLNIFHAFPQPRRQARTLKSLIAVASSAGELERVVEQLQLDAWFEAARVTVEERREFYLLIAEKLAAAGKVTPAHNHLLVYLSSFNGLAITDAAKKHAHTALVQALALPTFFDFERLLRMDAIKALASATPVDPAYPLLDIFVHHRLAEYRAHVTAHPAVFTTLHLDEKACTAKMRLVSLAALAAEHLGEALAYGEVARMVEVGEDEVELWVIDAIRRGLIEAKMDQVKRTVVVGRSTYRIFGAEQWQLLEKKLVDWQAGLDHIERVLDNVQDMVESEMPPAMV